MSKQREELTKRFRRAYRGSGYRLYWKANNPRWYRVFDSDDLCIVTDGFVTLHIKTIEALEDEIESEERQNMQIYQPN